MALDNQPLRLEAPASPALPPDVRDTDDVERLPHAALPPTPVLPLLRARWPWLVAATALGIAGGALAGGSSTYTATAVLRLNDSGQDALRTKQIAQTAERQARSVDAISRAARQRGTTPEDLGPRIKATWEQDTDLVDVTATSTSAQAAVLDANAVAFALIEQAESVSARRLENVRDDAGEVLRLGRVADKAAEAARREALGTTLAGRQNSAISDAAFVYVSQPAVDAGPAGPSRLVSGGLGAVGGLLLGVVAVLLAGLGRRRVRSVAELRSLSPDLRLLESTQAGEVAGALLERGRSTLAVLALDGASNPAVRFASSVVGHVRTHGASVTLVNAVAPDTGPAGSGTARTLPDEVWVLRRDIRRNVKSYFSTDTLVVACSADPEAVGLIAGQSDLLAVIVAKRRRTTVQEIRDAVAVVAGADPVVVLVP